MSEKIEIKKLIRNYGVQSEHFKIRINNELNVDINDTYDQGPFEVELKNLDEIIEALIQFREHTKEEIKYWLSECTWSDNIEKEESE